LLGELTAFSDPVGGFKGPTSRGRGGRTGGKDKGGEWTVGKKKKVIGEEEG